MEILQQLASCNIYSLIRERADIVVAAEFARGAEVRPSRAEGACGREDDAAPWSCASTEIAENMLHDV